MRYLMIVLLSFFTTTIWAQQQESSADANSTPVMVRRSGPDQQITGQNSAATATATKVPADFKPKTDVPLSPTAQSAVKVSDHWLNETNTPTPGADGRVTYLYGAGLPIVVCSPLRICIIELEPGERLVGAPHVGDSLRWRISPASYGKANTLRTVLVLKPQEPGLDTTLLVTTERRAYYLRIISKPEDFTARIAFEYPEQTEDQWKAFLAQQEQEKQAEDQETPLSPIESMNFGYTFKGGDDSIRPLQVFDDGKKTFIKMNPKMKFREAPALVVIGPDERPEMLNYRVKDDMYVVDRLFDRAELVLGAGKKAKKVEIIREGARKS